MPALLGEIGVKLRSIELAHIYIYRVIHLP